MSGGRLYRVQNETTGRRPNSIEWVCISAYFLGSNLISKSFYRFSIWSYNFPAQLTSNTGYTLGVLNTTVHVRVSRDYIRFNQWSVPWSYVRSIKRKREYSQDQNAATQIQFLFTQRGRPLPVVDYTYLNISIRPPKMRLNFESQENADQFLNYLLESGYVLEENYGFLGRKIRFVPAFSYSQ